MSPPTFYGSNVDEDPQGFLNRVYKVLNVIKVTSSEKVELDSYQLNNVSQTLYVQLRENRPLRGGSVTWEIFNEAFLDRFFPREMSEEKVTEFINILQGGKIIHE